MGMLNVTCDLAKDRQQHYGTAGYVSAIPLILLALGYMFLPGTRRHPSSLLFYRALCDMMAEITLIAFSYDTSVTPTLLYDANNTRIDDPSCDPPYDGTNEKVIRHIAARVPMTRMPAELPSVLDGIPVLHHGIFVLVTVRTVL